MSLEGVQIDQYNFSSSCIVLSVSGKSDKIILHVHGVNEDKITQLIQLIQIASTPFNLPSFHAANLDSLYPVEENSDSDEEYPILQHSESPIDSRYLFTIKSKHTMIIKKRWFDIDDKGELFYYLSPHDLIPKGSFLLKDAKIVDYDRSPITCHRHIESNLSSQCCHIHRRNNRYKSCFELHAPSFTDGYIVIHCHDSHIDSANDSRSYIINKLKSIIGTDSDETKSFTQYKEKVSLNDFTLLRIIGQGSFGKVVLVKKNDTDNIYAMKMINKVSIINKKQVDHTLSERKILEQIRHPFIVQLYYAFQTDKKLYFVLDYCGGGDIFFHLHKKKCFSEDEVIFYISEIVLALTALHSANIIYRDLKPENVLLDDKGHVKLSDFGLAKIGKKEQVEGNTFCGSSEYLAPEVINREHYGIEVDWWSLGCLLYQLLVGKPPFYCGQNSTRVYQNILEGTVKYPDTLSRDVIKFIRELLQKDPMARLGSGPTGDEDIRNHRYFTRHNISWDNVYEKKLTPPIIPTLNDILDTNNFDKKFTSLSIESQSEQASLSETEDDPFIGFSYEKSSSSLK